jgi:hypothetical protein
MLAPYTSRLYVQVTKVRVAAVVLLKASTGPQRQPGEGRSQGAVGFSVLLPVCGRV